MELTLDTIHQDLYENHYIAYAGDAGIDLFFVKDIAIPAKTTMLIDLEVSCQLKYNGGYFSYFLYPRSSIVKTPLRMSNSVGIIDSMYRNTLKVSVDNISDQSYTVTRGQRLFQICNADLSPMSVVLGKVSQSDRGEGFGSSG